MPLSESDFDSIRMFVDQIVRQTAGTRSEYFITSRVTKRDERKKLIWIKELDQQPIPIVGFDHEVKYYDVQPTGTPPNYTGTRTVKKVAQVTVKVPRVGETVLVAREWGIGRLPRCLGVIQGTDWIISED